MLSGLDLMELPVPGDDFALQLVRRVEESRASRAANRRSRETWAALAVGLSLVLLVSLAWYAQRSQTAVRGGALAARPTAPAAASADSRRGPVHGDSKRRRGNDARSASQPSVAASALLAIDQPPPLALLRAWTTSWSGRWNPVDGITDGLTPITTPLSVAVEEIRRAIPLGQADVHPAPSADSVRKEARREMHRIA